MLPDSFLQDVKKLSEASGFPFGIAERGGKVLYSADGLKLRPGDVLPGSGVPMVLFTGPGGELYILFTNGGDEAGQAHTLNALKLCALNIAGFSGNPVSFSEVLESVIVKKTAPDARKLEALYATFAGRHSYRLIVADSDGPDPDREQLESVRSVISEIFPLEQGFVSGLCCFRERYYAVLLCRCEADVGADEALRCEQYASQIYDTVSAEAMLSVRVAVSSRTEKLTALQTLMLEALDAIAVGRKFELGEKCLSYEKLSLERLICALPREASLEFVRAVLGDRLAEERTRAELLSTVRMFLDNNQNSSEVARLMYIHRNTVTYRLDKFQKLTGLDCTAFGDGLRIRLALKILDYLEHNG